MSSKKDDWEKPRPRHVHFTAEEEAVVMAAFKANRPAREVARELKCATRTIHMRYRIMRGDPVVRGHRTLGTRVVQRRPALLPERHYKSDFNI